MSANGAAPPGYYGRPIVKPPTWKAFIPIYFWTGGWAGACATLALASRLGKNDRAARTLIVAAAVGSAASAFCLIADLKKPLRFLHMLRVLRPSSPMSVGVYLFSVFGGAAMAGAASELTGIAPFLGRGAQTVAGICGPFMSVYTSVLIGDTVMPAWHHARTSLPMLFAATSASTAGGVGMIFMTNADVKPAQRLALLGAPAITLTLQRLKAELGPFQHEAYERGKAGGFSRAARFLNFAGCAATFFARRSRAAGKVAGAMLLAAGLAERFAVYEAGRISAEDPKFTIESQRR